MRFGELDADVGSEGPAQILGPLVVHRHEAFVVDVHLAVGDCCHAHHIISFSLEALSLASGVLPDIDISVGTGSFRPGSSPCQ